MLYGAFLAATITANILLEDDLPAPLQVYLEQEAARPLTGSMLMGAVLALPALGCLAAGWIGMFFFWRPSRWLFLAAQLLMLVAVCVFGPYVAHGVEQAIDSVGQALCGVILALAFLSPINRLFARPKRGQ